MFRKTIPSINISTCKRVGSNIISWLRFQNFHSYEKVVCPFVRLSVKRVVCDKTEERSVQIFISSFMRRRMVGGSDLIYLKFLVKLTPLERKR